MTSGAGAMSSGSGEDCMQVHQQVVKDAEPELEEQHQETIAC